MSWVRYDDGFDCHPKVTAVIADDPGAVALHVLANTWAARQKRPDFVPSHQPGLLVGSRAKGIKWAGLLERHGLWNAVDGGWEFHDHATYRNTSRQTPGTPADLSEKRAAAGRRGGKAAQQRKQTGKQDVEQNEQDVKQPASNPLSPVVASNEATPVPVQPSAAAVNAATTLTQRSRALTDGYSTAMNGMCKWPAVNAIVMRALRSEKWTDDDIAGALMRMSVDNRPVTVDSLRVELDGIAPAPRVLRAVSTTDTRVSETLALAAKYREEGQ